MEVVLTRREAKPRFAGWFAPIGTMPELAVPAIGFIHNLMPGR